MTPEERDARLEYERQKIPKLEILFGPWWKHYTAPIEFAFTLYCERDVCPYCGGALGPFFQSQTEATLPLDCSAHPDHMDPLLRGGEDSIRNTVYACQPCNLRKRSRSFVDWLGMIEPAFQNTARAIYVEKHGHEPEEFLPTKRSARLTTCLRSLAFDVSVLKTLFPNPVVSGPPAPLKLARTTMPTAGRSSV